MCLLLHCSEHIQRFLALYIHMQQSGFIITIGFISKLKHDGPSVKPLTAYIVSVLISGVVKLSTQMRHLELKKCPFYRGVLNSEVSL